MNFTREQVFQHLHVVHEGAPGWERSQAALLGEGNEAVPFLIEVLEIELNKVHGVLVVLSYQKLLRLTVMLAQFDDPRSLAWLLRVARQTNEPKAFLSYHQVLKTLERRASAADIQALIALMQGTTLRSAGLPFSMTLRSDEALLVAQALVRIAERYPQPELRAVLPLLAYTLSSPFEFIGLRKRLKTALGTDSLPIPATVAQTMGDLPLPSSNEESA